MKKQLLTLAAGLMISMNVNAITIDETNVINNAAVASGFPVESRDYYSLVTGQLIAEHWLDEKQEKTNRLICESSESPLIYDCSLKFVHYPGDFDSLHGSTVIDVMTLWSAECGNAGCMEAGK